MSSTQNANANAPQRYIKVYVRACVRAGVSACTRAYHRRQRGASFNKHGVYTVQNEGVGGGGGFQEPSLIWRGNGRDLQQACPT